MLEPMITPVPRHFSLRSRAWMALSEPRKWAVARIQSLLWWTYDDKVRKIIDAISGWSFYSTRHVQERISSSTVIRAVRSPESLREATDEP
jgi:hypothetical protein